MGSGMSKHTFKRFGSIAVEMGFITEEQLLEALAIQAKENIASATHRLLGQILLEEGMITETQIEKVLEVINYQSVYMISAGR